MRQGALQALRVLDVAGTVASAYCGKLFADHGADVVNVEPPGNGHAIRQLAPHKGGVANESSGLAAYLSVNKRSVVLDLGSAVADREFADLVAAADVLIADRDLPVGSLEVLAADHPQLLCISVSWFGRTGPYAHFVGSEGVIHALIGLARGIGTPAGPPLLPSGHQAQIIGGLTAYVGALGALAEQASEHARGVLDVSIFEANLCFTEPGVVGAFHAPVPPPVPAPSRLGINRFAPTFPMGIYPCKDGWIGVTALTPTQWQSFAELLELPALGREPKYYSTLARLEDADLIEAVMMPKLREKTALEWFRSGQAKRIPLAIVPTMAEIATVDQYAMRSALVMIEHPDLGGFTAPNTPFRLFATPPIASGVAPRLGADTDTVVSMWRDASPRVSSRAGASARSRATDASSEVPRAPLLGIRVIDLSMGWAGPLAARHLADLGAEVIKVEACSRFDWWRGWDATPETLAQNLHEKASAFNMVNRNKLGITLDLVHEEGKELLKRLVALCDIVIENYSGEVLAKLGLDYPSLEAVRPELVMVSMPAFGTNGPWRGYRAYGSTVEQISGLPHLNGHADWPPTMQHVAYGDAIGGINGAAAALTALFHRRETGHGQYCDLSQAECLFPLAAHGIVSQSLLGYPPQRQGSRREEACPSGVFPCAGDDAWVVIQVSGDEAWRALCERIGAAGLCDLAAHERRARETEIEARVADWTRSTVATAVMGELQSNGVAAAKLSTMADVLADPHLHARGFWQMRVRAFVGASPNPAAPYRFGAEPLRVQWPAPTLGQHNSRVLGDLLGLSDDALARLEASGVIGQRPSGAQTG